jgi:hypothetical protein
MNTRPFRILTIALFIASYQPAQAAVILQTPTATHVAFEAEQTPQLIAGTISNWERRTDAGASGGSALYAAGTTATATAPHSFAQYQLRFATAGTYYLYMRWRADPALTAGDVFTANSSFVANTFGAFSTPGDQASFHASASNGRNAPENNTYGWSREPEGNVYTVSATDVSSAAPLVFTIGTREAGMFVDRLVFSTVPDLADAALDALLNSEIDVVTQGTSRYLRLI